MLSSCGRNNVGGSAPELLVPVSAQIRFDTAIVARGKVANVTQRAGFVSAEALAVNFGPVAAFFRNFYVLPGDAVSYGQLLARLDMEQLETQIARHEERIVELQMEFDFDNELRRIDLEMLIAEGANPAISHARLELELALERQALVLSHENADLQKMQTQLEQSELRAPFDGTVVYVAGQESGSWVAPFEPMLLITPDDAQVFVEYIGGTSIPQGVDVQIQAHIGSQVYTATRISVTREQALRYGHTPTRFILESETHPPIGTFVSLIIYTSMREDVLRLPRNALFFNQDMGFYVYLITNGQLEMVVITTGLHTETYVEVLGGVAEGDEVYVRS